jgi:hypothetical protein
MLKARARPSDQTSSVLQAGDRTEGHADEGTTTNRTSPPVLDAGGLGGSSAPLASLRTPDAALLKAQGVVWPDLLLEALVAIRFARGNFSLKKVCHFLKKDQ